MLFAFYVLNPVSSPETVTVSENFSENGTYTYYEQAGFVENIRTYRTYREDGIRKEAPVYTNTSADWWLKSKCTDIAGEKLDEVIRERLGTSFQDIGVVGRSGEELTLYYNLDTGKKKFESDRVSYLDFSKSVPDQVGCSVSIGDRDYASLVSVDTEISLPDRRQ